MSHRDSGRQGCGEQWDGGWQETTAAAPHHGPAPARGLGYALAGVAVGAVIMGLVALVLYLLFARDNEVQIGTAGPTPESEDSSWTTSEAGVAVEPPEQSAFSGTAPESGTYSGILSQRGTTSGRSDKNFYVAMRFSSGGSSVDYPSLGCSGTLAPQGDRDGARVYLESITSGNCDPSGTWIVTRGSASSVSVEYRPVSGNHIVVGQLTR